MPGTVLGAGATVNKIHKDLPAHILVRNSQQSIRPIINE